MKIGTEYFGVRNDGNVLGQEVSDKTLRDIGQAAPVLKELNMPAIKQKL